MFSNVAQLKDFFQTKENIWIFKHLKVDEKNSICKKIVEDNNVSFILNFVEIRDIFEKIVFLEFESMAKAFEGIKNSTFNKIDFSDELNTDGIVSLISRNETHIKKCSADEISKTLFILKSLPLSFCTKNFKTKVCLLLLCLYKDLIAAKHLQLAEEVLNLLVDVCHFGENVVLHKYMTFKLVVSLISPKNYPMFYTMLFNNLKLDLNTGKKFIESVVEHIEQMNDDDEMYFELLNLCITYLSSSLAPKDWKKHLECLYMVTWKNVETFFIKELDKEYEGIRLFVEKSLPSFCNYFNSFFNKLETDSEMDEHMRKICKIYIGNSVSFIYLTRNLII